MGAWASRRRSSAILIIDHIEGMFEGGKKRVQGDYYDSEGRRCLWAALVDVKDEHRLQDDHPVFFCLDRAISHYRTYGGKHSAEIIVFNDSCTSYGEMLEMLDYATKIALARAVTLTA